MEKTRDFYVYQHARASDGRVFYVGKGKGYRANSRYGRNPHWRNIVAKHGVAVELVADGLTEPEAHEVEIALIAHHRLWGDGLANLTDGGEGASGRVMPEAQKQKLSEANSGERHPQWGKPLSAHHRAALRGDGNPMFGKTGPANSFYNPEPLAFERIATGERFDMTRTEARRQLGLTKQGIADLIAGRKKTSRGYRLLRDAA